MVSFKEVWPNEFERFVVFNTIRLKAAVNVFISEFFLVFYFPSDFVIVVEHFLKGFLKSFSSK